MTLFLLALADLRHYALASFCMIACLCGILVPMGLVLAMKIGLIDRMVDALVASPVNREIVVYGSGRYDQTFFDAAEAEPSLGFVVPNTRPISAQADWIRSETSEDRRTERAVSLIPSAAGDPLLDGTTNRELRDGQVGLSESLAAKLDIGVGARVEMTITRVIGAEQQAAQISYNVAAVVPAELHPRDALILPLAELVAVERFRDRQDITQQNWRQSIPTLPHYSSMRVYAADITTLSEAIAWLGESGIEARPKIENALILLRIQNGIATLFTIVGVLAGGGIIAALAANLRGSVDRQKRDLSLTAMFGLSPLERGLIPVLQSVVLTGLGLVASGLLLLLTVPLLNHLIINPAGLNPAILPLPAVLNAAVLSFLLACLSSLWAAVSAARIPVSEVLQDVS